MEKFEMILNLTRPAQKQGGDRYESADGFSIYIPQTMSRATGRIAEQIKLTIETVRE